MALTAGRHAIILADGAAPTRAMLDAAWPGWDADLDLVLAADGGARHAASLGLRIERWVGDGDSIEPALLDSLAAAGVAIERVAAEKDESDAELALLAAIEGGAARVTIGRLGCTTIVRRGSRCSPHQARAVLGPRPRSRAASATSSR